jgi:DNA-binding response OmpR family regulator
MRLLVVEDEPDVQHLIATCLRREGYDVDAVASATEAMRLASAMPYDALLLDMRIPEGSGFEVVRSLRRSGIDTPVMCVTACAAVEDRVRGLELGADDYLCKPFALAELVARVRALLRRRRGGDGLGPLRAGDVEIDVVRRVARRNGREVELTNREFDLLRFLAVNAGRPVSREEIMQEVWRERRSPDLMTNVIDVYVNGLRKKLADPGEDATRLIQTVRGLGYMLRAAAGEPPVGAAGAGPAAASPPEESRESTDRASPAGT